MNRAMRLFLRFASAGVLLGLMTTSGFALAAPSAQELANAEAMFKQGNEAMKKGQWKEACTAFGASNDIDPSPGTQINLALCNEKQGKTATAWGLYLTAANLASDRGQKERVDLARAEAAKLEPKLHKLVVSVKTPQQEGLVVTTDGVTMKSTAFGAELPVDPGEHVVEATAKGKKPFKGSVKAAPGPGIDRIEVPAFEDDPNAAKPVGPVTGDKPQNGGTEYNPPTGQDTGSTKKVVGFVLGGTGVVLAGVAIVLEIVASSENSKSNDQKAAADAIKPIGPAIGLTAQQIANRTAAQASAEDHHSAAKNDQIAAIVTGVGALALLGTGIYLIATSPSGGSSPKPAGSLSKPMFVPILSHDTAGLGLVGRF